MVFIIHIDQIRGYNVAPPPCEVNHFTEEGVTNDTLRKESVF